MDLEEWEFLPDDGFLDFHEDGVKKKIFHRDPKSIFNMNHFICPSSPTKIINPSTTPTPPPPPPKSKPKNSIVPIRFENPKIDDHHDDDNQLKGTIAKVPIEICVLPSTISEKMMIRAPNLGGGGGGGEADQDAVSQVFFKKMKENEFVDMKMDSPKSGNRGIVHQIDAGAFQFDDNNNNNNSKGESAEKKNPMDAEMITEEVMNWEENSGGLNLWRWSLNGIGTLCSVGVAAATICILIFGNQQRNKQHQLNQKQLQFQIYTDDKRIKQVVHHATKLNEAISAVRGVPLTRAHITIGGYYEGL